jgi:hypothetical protein
MEHTRTGQISTHIPFVAGDLGQSRMAGTLTYDPGDPYAVSLHLASRDDSATWVFSRQLLADGVYNLAGDGDVQIWPCLSSEGEAVVLIELSSPDGVLLLEAPSRVVAGFVCAAQTSVPAGTESKLVDLDAMLTHLLR